MAQADFLDNVKKSFADVPIDAANDNAIDTIAFLQASEEMLKLVCKIRQTRPKYCLQLPY